MPPISPCHPINEEIYSTSCWLLYIPTPPEMLILLIVQKLVQTSPLTTLPLLSSPFHTVGDFFLIISYTSTGVGWGDGHCVSPRVYNLQCVILLRTLYKWIDKVYHVCSIYNVSSVALLCLFFYSMLETNSGFSWWEKVQSVDTCHNGLQFLFLQKNISGLLTIESPLPRQLAPPEFQTIRQRRGSEQASNWLLTIYHSYAPPTNIAPYNIYTYNI
jgi:hypothetical protein